MIRRHLLPLAAWTAAWAIFFAPLLLGLARLPNGDFTAQFHSFALFQSSEVAAGRLPFWSPGSYGGFPFAADTQAAVFYPLRWLTLLATLPWGLSVYALQLEALGHVWLAGVFTYCLAFDLTHRRAAALLAALAFALGGYLVSYPVQQLAILETIAWLPLVLLLMRRAFRSPARTVAWLAASAAVLGLSLLAGHPQTLLQISYLAAAYYFFQAWQARWRWTWALGLGALYAIIVVGVSAAAWLPALRYAAETTRVSADYAFVATGFPLLDYLQALVPGALTLWSPQYIGLAGLWFVVLAWVGRAGASRESRAELAFWSLAALSAAWLSLGDSGILFELAYRVLPGLSLFRQQERWVGVFSFSLALAAAQGLTLWAQSGVAWARRAGVAVAAALGVAGLILAAAQSVAQAGWVAVWARQWGLLAGLLAAALLAPVLRIGRAGRNAHWQNALPMAALVLLAVDLFLTTRPTMGLIAESPAVFWPQPAWMTTLQNDRPGRVDTQNLFVANVGEAYGLEDIRGISPLKPTAVERYEQLPRRVRWQLLNVTHVVAPEPLEAGLEPLAPVTESILPGEPLNATLYRFTDALPRVWAVREVLRAESDEAALAMMSQPGFDPARQAVLSGNVANDVPVMNDSLPPLMTTERTPRGLDLTLDAEAPVLVVISEWRRDGWHATLDATTELPILRANAGLSAVYVPAGQHTVTLRFQSADVWVGLGLSLAALALAVLAGTAWRLAVPTRAPAGGLPRAAAPAGALSTTAGDMTAIRWRAALIAIVLLGFGLRVFMLGSQELRGDEAFSYLFTRLPLGGVVPELIDQGDPHPPAPYLMLNVWAGLVGDSELALRYLSALAGTALLPVLAFLGRRMAGARVGLVTAGLAAVAPGLVWLAQDARTQYTLVILFAALATAVLVETAHGQRRILRWVIYAALAVLTVYQHYYGVLALLSHGLYLWFAPGRRRDLPLWIVSGVVAALALAPWLLVSATGLVDAGHLSDPSQPDLARHLALAGMDLLVGQMLPLAAGRWLFLGGLAIAVVGGAALLRERATTGWGAMLSAWLAVALLVTYLVRFSRGTFNPYYVSIAAPAWWLLLSAGLFALWPGDRQLPSTLLGRRAVAVAAPIILLAALIAGLANNYFNPAYSRTLGYRAVAARLATAASPDDVFIDHFPDPVLDYYLRGLPLTRSLQPAGWNTPVAATEANLRDLAATHERLWFVPYTGSVWDPDNVVGRWLDDNLLAETAGEYGRQRLLAYRALPGAQSVMMTVGQTAGDVTLLAAYVTVDGQAADPAQPIALTPGASVAVTLLWEAQAAPPADYTAFVHLLDGSGALVAQHDGVPHDGTRPTSTWLPGEHVLDRHVVTVPAGAAGDGRLVVGLYDSATVERLTFETGRDAVDLTSVRTEGQPQSQP